VDVFIPRPPGGEFLPCLRRDLDPAVRLTDGPAAEVLVEGVPTREQLETAPALRAVVVPYAGVSRKTRELLAEFPGLTLHNLHHNAAATAETALALMLAAAKRIVPVDRALRRGDWRPRYEETRDFLCAGKTALVLGYGAIGRRIGAACKALGMEVLAVRSREAPGAFGPAALPELLPRTNVLLICLPLTPRTEGLIGARELGLLQPGALLVNVARGPVVDEGALHDALREGRIAAGIDVWYCYPDDEAARERTPPSRFPFHELDNVVMSPHRAGSAMGIERLRARHLASMLNAAARGKRMPNRVDLVHGY